MAPTNFRVRDLFISMETSEIYYLTYVLVLFIIVVNCIVVAAVVPTSVC